MSFKKIMAISGTGGLFKVVAQTKNGFIVESMQDGKRSAVSSYQKISILEDVSIYGKTDDMPLRKVMQMMDEKAEASLAMNPKASSAELQSFLTTVFPDNDGERIYPSDIKKLIQWYRLLKDKVSFEDDKEETATEEVKSEDAEPKQEETKVEAAAPKKASSKKKAESETEKDGDQPVKEKKAPRKKKTEE